MKMHADVVEGRIVGYDHRRGELLIRAPYDDIPTLLKRSYQTCLVQPVDSRPLSSKQRRLCYALLREIGDYTAQSPESAKEWMKLKFLAEDLRQTGDKIFSLGNAPMSLVCAFQRFLVRFILDWDIPCRFSLLDYAEDTADYLYHCLVTKKCCICGGAAELHRLDWEGGSRRESIREGMEVVPLCREHHREAHAMSCEAFLELHHLPGGVVMDRTLCRMYRCQRERKDERTC